mgnify:CR=1 FL=1
MRSFGGSGNQLGITLSFSSVRPASNDPADVEAARRVDGNTVANEAEGYQATRVGF